MKTLIIRVFTPKGKSVSKYSLIFRGKTENSYRKIKNCLQFESAPYRFHFCRRERHKLGHDAAVFTEIYLPQNFYKARIIMNVGNFRTDTLRIYIIINIKASAIRVTKTTTD